MSDRTGTARLAASDQDVAFTRLYRLFHRPIRDFCRRRVGAPLVDDTVADVFLTAWRRLDEVPEGEDALLWLYRVAFRVIGHQWRGMARRQRLQERLRWAVPRPCAPADESLGDDVELRMVLEASARLGETDAEVLRLSAWEQLSVGDIAVVLDIAPNAVNQRLHRARRNLAREYRRLEGRRAGTPGVEGGGAS